MKIRNLVLGALCGITFFSCSASGGGKDAEMDRFLAAVQEIIAQWDK